MVSSSDEEKYTGYWTLTMNVLPTTGFFILNPKCRVEGTSPVKPLKLSAQFEIVPSVYMTLVMVGKVSKRLSVLLNTLKLLVDEVLKQFFTLFMANV